MFLSKRQNGNYYLFFTDENTGKRKMMSCKTKKKPEAIKFLTNFKNGSQVALNQKSNVVYYLEDLQKEVIKYVSDNLRLKTLLLYKDAFNDLLRIIGNKPLRLIDFSEIENFKSIRLKEVSQTTVNIRLATIKAIFNLAVKFNFIYTNPCKDIKKISIPQKERLCFNEIEVSLILNNCINPMMKDFIKFALLTGCRLDEICNVQWKDINFPEQILNISNKDNFNTKSGKLRKIPISDELMKLLNEMLEQKPTENVLSLYNPDYYIFSIRYGTRLRIDYVSKSFKKILRRCNFPERYHFHCLRHTFITNLIKSGVNINYVKELAGHSGISTTMGYVHILTNDLREAMNKINLA